MLVKSIWKDFFPGGLPQLPICAIACLTNVAICEFLGLLIQLAKFTLPAASTRKTTPQFPEPKSTSAEARLVRAD